MRYWCVITLLVMLHLHGNAQVFSFEHYTPANGLAQSQITSICQDDNGILWIGTRNGLSSFDGIEFKNYYARDGLVNNFIHAILKKEDGTIVVFGEDGYAYFRNDTLTPISLDEYEIKGRIRGQTIDEDDNIWLIVNYGHSKNRLFKIKNDSALELTEKYKSSKFSLFTDIHYHQAGNKLFIEYENRQINAFSDDSSYIVASGKKVNLSSGHSNSIIINIGEEDFLLTEDSLMPIQPEIESYEVFTPLVISNSDLNKIALKNREKISVFSWSHGRILGFFIDRDSTIWLKGEEGLFRISSRAFLNFTSDHGLATNIWSVVEDHDHNVWFASLNNSLQKWDGQSLINTNAYKSIVDPPFYMGSRVMSDGTIMFTHGMGVMSYKNGKFSDVPYVKNQTEFVYESPIDSTIMIGTVRGLILRKNNKTRLLSRFSAHGDGFVTGIAYDPKGFYWIVSSETVAQLFPDDSTYVFGSDESPIECGYSVVVDKSGMAWFGCKKGLYVYGKDGFESVELNGITVNALQLMDNKKIMLGRMKDFVILDIEKWRNNENDFYEIYDKAVGFDGYEVQQNGIMKDHEGKYWISCIDRVIRYDPQEDRIHDSPPLLSVTSIESMKSSLDWRLYKNLNYYNSSEPLQLFLDHRQKTIKINFRGITSYAPEKVEYSYRVKERDKEWSESSSNHYAVLTDLKPGSYLFEIKARNLDKITSKPVRIKLEMLPAFWQTLAFKIIGLVIFSALLVYIVSSILLKRQRKKEELRKLKADYHNVRIKEIIKQFDPHFTFNILSSLGYFILRERKELAYDYLLKFSDLLRGILSGHDQLMKTLREELHFIETYCEIQKFILADKLNYHISQTPEEIEHCQVPKMIIHTFVENAIKHGIMPLEGEGKLEVKIKHDEEFIFIIIKDNGKGREYAQKYNSRGTGKGVELTERIFQYLSEKYKKPFRLYFNDLFDDEGDPSGTEVHLSIPRL